MLQTIAITWFGFGKILFLRVKAETYEGQLQLIKGLQRINSAYRKQAKLVPDIAVQFRNLMDPVDNRANPETLGIFYDGLHGLLCLLSFDFRCNSHQRMLSVQRNLA